MIQEERMFRAERDVPAPRDPDENFDSLIGRVEGWNEALIVMSEKAARIQRELRAALGLALVDDGHELPAGLCDRVGMRLEDLSGALTYIEDLIGARDA